MCCKEKFLLHDVKIRYHLMKQWQLLNSVQKPINCENEDCILYSDQSIRIDHIKQYAENFQSVCI